MVTKADLEKLKIDVVDELHKVRRMHAGARLIRIGTRIVYGREH